ncbi:MAG: hypothetical protein M0P59_12685 [Gallionella sp.]|jgi:hypothetical protein|nr:hypothetical protein [Gallionella sp.]MCK9354999.1 hypothetical protein [Gallionella sp.]
MHESTTQAANRIDAHIEFSFKGESYDLSSTLDLDRVLEKYLTLPSLHIVLAVEHGIDTYSYLYEVMQEEEIRFDNAQGMAVDFLKDGVFDLDGYTARWGVSNLTAPLQIIVQQEMGIENLEQHPQLKSALLRAYQLGMEA